MKKWYASSKNGSPPIVFTKMETIKTGVYFFSLENEGPLFKQEALYSTQCQWVAQGGLELMIFLAQPLKYWLHWDAHPHLT